MRLIKEKWEKELRGVDQALAATRVAELNKGYIWAIFYNPITNVVRGKAIKFGGMLHTSTDEKRITNGIMRLTKKQVIEIVRLYRKKEGL